MNTGRWLLAGLFAAPMVMNAAKLNGQTVPWYEQRRDSSLQAPDPAQTHEAVLQVYAARTVGWRGVFAVHTWVVVKPTGAPRYTRYEVIGFGVGPVVVPSAEPPVGSWQAWQVPRSSNFRSRLSPTRAARAAP